MLQLIRQIAPYGTIFIEAQRRRWWVACEVKLPGDVLKGVVKARNEKLYFELKDLLELAKEEHKRLWEIQRAPNQGKFDYGCDNPDWQEIA
jgi:hypothetical protein